MLYAINIKKFILMMNWLRALNGTYAAGNKA